MKSGLDALSTTEKVSASAINENGTLKMITGVQNMKMGPNALGTAEKEYGDAKLENGARHPLNRRKRVRERKKRKCDPTPSELPKMSPGAQNVKTGPDALGTAENESGSAKHENGT
jgi:hypothetical protein